MKRYVVEPEWVKQAGILLVWPHEKSDWSANMAAAVTCYIDLIAAIAKFESVHIIVPQADLAKKVCTMVGETRYPLVFHSVPTNDTWVRDSGPISADFRGQGGWLDFRFDAWGGKFAADEDDLLVSRMVNLDHFSHISVINFDWVLEGGSIEVDGQGTVMTTRQCLTNRNPDLGIDGWTERLQDALGVDRVLWVNYGHIAGDDTDGHIDTIARFANPHTIVYQGCSDDSDIHFADLAKMSEQLRSFSQPDGRSYNLIELPLPAAIFNTEGERLPATYANFLIGNGAVFMPTYDDPADAKAADQLALAFPDRKIIPVDCRALIEQGGSLHCATMQLPESLFD